MSSSAMPPSASGLRAWCRATARHAVHQLRLFFTALQFFTRLPIPRWVGFDAAWLQHATRYFPAVGLLVGLVTALVYGVAGLLWPGLLAVMLSTVAGIYLTGAFHEDGFADVCDGFGGGMQPQRILDIMRDSRVGAYGAIGIVAMLAIKITTLASLPVAQVIPALLLAHPLSRCLAAALIWRMDYVREEGKAKPLAQQMSTAEFIVAAITVLIPALLIAVTGWLPWSGMAAGALLALFATLFLARKFDRRIGGYTGDCLGAVQQLSEACFYLGLLANLQF